MDYRIEQLRYLLREDPSSRIFYQLGELLRREGEAEQAVQVLRNGLERHPRYVAAWVLLGRSLADLGALDEAGDAFEKALAIDRDNAVAARLIGETAVGRGDWLRAVKALKLARALTGGDAGLDAQIALVEDRLDEHGQLEAPKVPEAPRAAPAPEVAEAPPEPPPRSLEVVSLSSADPFADAADDARVWRVESDVFELVEKVEPVETVETGEEAVEAEDVRTFEPVEVAEAVEMAAAAAEDAGADEAQVGAWASSSGWVGVAADRAWLEPTGELDLDDGAADRDLPWAAPPAEVDDLAAAAATRSPAGEDRGPGTDALTRPIPVPQAMIEPETAASAEEAPRRPVGDPDPATAGGGRRHELDHGVPLPTMTLARLALAQNDSSLAMATLESLIERDPNHREAADLLEELTRAEAAAEHNRGRSLSAAAKITALQGWLDAVRLAAERRAQ